MATNWLRITHQSETIQLSWQRGYENPRLAPAVTFQQPFDEENAAELRWYLEDYLKFPYGIFPDNAAKIEQKLQHWGQHLFELVFRTTEKGREFFQEATRDGLDKCELGRVAEEQRQFDVAINYYQKTWEIYEQFRDWYWASATLGKWGRVLEAQENYTEALPIYIRVLSIDLEHNQDWISYRINALGRMLQQLGESQFQVI